jgi:hypothetical protein
MEAFFTPPPEVLAFLFLKKFIYLEMLFFLSVVRRFWSADTGKRLAELAIVICVIGIFAQFGPSLLNIYTGPIPILAGVLTGWLGGAGLPLLGSAVFFWSGRRASSPIRILDILNFGLVLSLLTLWIWTSI